MESFFGENLRKLRKDKKISLETLSEQLAISKSTLSDYENQKTFPPINLGKKIAAFFGYDLSQMDGAPIAENTPILGYKGQADLEIYVQELQKKEEEIQHLSIQLRLQAQQTESLQVQVKLQSQLIESKNSEITLLKIQVSLLEEKVKKND
jgi:transcriptional regulator with XRE-family HTH domain